MWPRGLRPSSRRCSGGRRWAPSSRGRPRAAVRKAPCQGPSRSTSLDGIMRARATFSSRPTGRATPTTRATRARRRKAERPGHGTSSPYDIHNPLIAAGPDVREHAVSDVPTRNVDLAPTVLRLLGLPVPDTMTGRVIEEALRDGPPLSSVQVGHVTETVKTADASYELTAHISIAAGRHYLDFTDVKRR